MPVSEAKRASNAAWDAANMAYQTVKVRREILEAFRAACAARGDKVNTVLREAMEAYTGGTLQQTERAEDGGYVLLAETEAAARAAAEANGEDPAAWLDRAIKDTAKRDEFARMLKR